MRIPKVILLVAALLGSSTVHAAPRRLKVSENRRFLVRDDGAPFFWLGDTAWELFHRLDRPGAERYLKDRAAKGFTVIQAVVLAELDGLNVPNPYGHRPLHEDDPTRPNEPYFQHVDWIVARANALGLVVGMLPTWGDRWNAGNRSALFDVDNAEKYGAWLGRRYRDSDLVWILGGDRGVDNERHRQITAAMAKGLRAGDGGAHLITFHPPGGQSSAQYFHDQDWLDFNMRQNGHSAEFQLYGETRADYDRKPTKPVIDGEPVYEDHPLSFDAGRFGHSIAADTRRPLYWDLFRGAFGHTYGNHAVWQMWSPERAPVNGPIMPWYDAIAQPGAEQMQHARWLLESRPFLTRVPADDMLLPETVTTAMPGAGRYRFVATRDEAGSYAMVYAPTGRPFTLKLDALQGKRLKAWWFDPRTGAARPLGTFPATAQRTFVSPARGEAIDWVLVIDDAAKNYPPPGTRKKRPPVVAPPTPK